MRMLGLVRINLQKARRACYRHLHDAISSTRSPHTPRHRLPDHHHLHRRIRRDGDGQNADSLHPRIAKRPAREEDRQLNDFIARFSAGPAPRRSPVAQRGRAAANQRPRPLQHRTPYIRFDQVRPSGKHALDSSTSPKSTDDQTVIDGFTANVLRGERICLMGRTRRQNHPVKSFSITIPAWPTRTSL